METKNIKITAEKFNAFETLRAEGSINMLDIAAGTLITGLTRDEYINIIVHYSQYRKEFLNDN